MFRTIIRAAGFSLKDFAQKIGDTPQCFHARLKSQTIALLFLIVKTIGSKLILEFSDGKKIDLMQFDNEFTLTKRLYAKRCKET